MVIPSDLRPYFPGKKEIRLSLKTSYLKEARPKVIQLAARVFMDFPYMSSKQN